ncbi:hypothetical protein [Cellulomonas denverensis]|uniref:hypothetical protein n=1 Tax=Cellulomonas denverensis TaxID=264297 RepID=UPI001A378CC3|nr:hypothetical protein Cde04nite_33550 [Cellulomonas denverensis]
MPCTWAMVAVSAVVVASGTVTAAALPTGIITRAERAARAAPVLRLRAAALTEISIRRSQGRVTEVTQPPTSIGGMSDSANYRWVTTW